MSYRNKGCDKYSSLQIQSWMDDTKHVLDESIKHNAPEERITELQKQIDDLHADLILKKQEEKEEMKSLLKRLSQIIELL